MDAPSFTNKACVHKVTRPRSCPTVQTHPGGGHNLIVWQGKKKEGRGTLPKPADKQNQTYKAAYPSLTHWFARPFTIPSIHPPGLKNEQRVGPMEEWRKGKKGK